MMPSENTYCLNIQNKKPTHQLYINLYRRTNYKVVPLFYNYCYCYNLTSPYYYSNNKIKNQILIYDFFIFK